ncbi:MAG TPA: hypothetical protein VF529_02245 [Solirubrobacteraceae bacterium]
MIARALIVLGAAVAVGGSLTDYFPNLGAMTDSLSGRTFLFSDGLSIWEASSGEDIAFAAVGAAAALLALLGLLRAAALAAAMLAGTTLLDLVEFLAQDLPLSEEAPAVWLMPLGGAIALAGAALALRQRSTRAA